MVCVTRAMRIALPLVGITIAAELLRARQRYRDAIRGQFCLDCGYDVRYSDLRCPECGRPIDRPKHAPKQAPKRAEARVSMT